MGSREWLLALKKGMLPLDNQPSDAYETGSSDDFLKSYHQMIDICATNARPLSHLNESFP